MNLLFLKIILDLILKLLKLSIQHLLYNIKTNLVNEFVIGLLKISSAHV